MTLQKQSLIDNAWSISSVEGDNFWFENLPGFDDKFYQLISDELNKLTVKQLKHITGV